MKPRHLIACLLVLLATTAHAQNAISLTKGDSKITVKIGDEFFTEYLYGKERSKPILYPIHAPGGIRMVRNHPIAKSAEDQPVEAKDHPHHESLWYTHGDVNGISFWHIGKGKMGTIVQKKLVKAEGDTIVSKNDWISPKGEVQCSDETTITFGTTEGARTIDYTVTIHASSGDVTFGDTKEGSMGIRTHPNLRLRNGSGVTTANGSALNSNGEKGKGIWGKNAAWVAYWGKVDDKPVGLGIFDHPSNPRHPTTWHARDYGLIAANPFGLSNFQGKKRGAGNMTIKNGESVTFKYRFVFYAGDPESAGVGKMYDAWAKK